MRHAPVLTFGLTLVLLTQPAWAQPAAKKKAPEIRPAPVAEAPLRFPLDQQRQPFITMIDSVDASGAVETRPAGNIPGPPPGAGNAITEGYYLGVVQAVMGPGLDGARLMRVQITEVGDNDSLKLQLGKSAIEAIKPGEFLVLFRPAGASTALMKQLPDLAPLEEGPPPGEKKRDPGETAKLNQSFNNLKLIGLALHNFHDAYGHFPPAVIVGPDNKPWHSWRVLILPFLDQGPLYNMYKFDEPWDGPSNKKLLGKFPLVFADPIHADNKNFYTHYAAITGDDMAFTAEGADFDGKNIGPAMSGGRGIAQFTDGTSNTLLIGPVGADRKIPWMKPEDIVVDDKFPDLGKKGGFATPYKFDNGNAGPFLFADGAVRGLLDSIDHNVFHTLLTLDGGEAVGNYPSVNAPGAGGQVPVLYIIKEGDKTTARMTREPMEAPQMMPGMPPMMREAIRRGAPAAVPAPAVPAPVNPQPPKKVQEQPKKP